LRWASFFWIQSLVKGGGARAFFDNLDHSIIKTRAGAAMRTKRRWGGRLRQPAAASCRGVSFAPFGWPADPNFARARRT
jgi:hypothetical protein